MAEQKLPVYRPAQQDQSGTSRPTRLRRDSDRRVIKGHARGHRLVIFRGRVEQKIIEQADLEEFFFLERELREATARWKSKQDYILKLIKSGATIQPGVHTAEIVSTLKVR